MIALLRGSEILARWHGLAIRPKAGSAVESDYGSNLRPPQAALHWLQE